MIKLLVDGAVVIQVRTRTEAEFHKSKFYPRAKIVEEKITSNLHSLKERPLATRKKMR